MLTIPTTSVTFSSEPIHGTDKKKVTLSLVVPVIPDKINETFNALLRFDELLNDASVDTQFSNGLGMAITDDGVNNIVVYKFIL
jgi:hypothetical protein